MLRQPDDPLNRIQSEARMFIDIQGQICTTAHSLLLLDLNSPDPFHQGNEVRPDRNDRRTWFKGV